MGRPKVIRVPDFGGEVSLKNVTPELTDKIKNLVLGSAASATPLLEAPEEDEAIPTYTGTSFGVFQNNDGLWCVAIVKYDPRLRKATFEDVIKCGFEREEAEERYKILSAQKGVIKS